MTEKARGKEVPAQYTVEVERGGCERCGNGKLWFVVDPDGIAGSTSYLNEQDAEDMAFDLNRAYELGRRHAKTP